MTFGWEKTSHIHPVEIINHFCISTGLTVHSSHSSYLLFLKQMGHIWILFIGSTGLECTLLDMKWESFDEPLKKGALVFWINKICSVLRKETILHLHTKCLLFQKLNLSAKKSYEMIQNYQLPRYSHVPGNYLGSTGSLTLHLLHRNFRRQFQP